MCILAIVFFQLLPLLLESLSCKDPGVWQAILATLEELLKDNPSLLADHVDELIPRMLTHATYKPNMVNRTSVDSELFI